AWQSIRGGQAPAAPAAAGAGRGGGGATAPAPAARWAPHGNVAGPGGPTRWGGPGQPGGPLDRKGGRPHPHPPWGPSVPGAVDRERGGIVLLLESECGVPLTAGSEPGEISPAWNYQVWDHSYQVCRRVE